MLNQESILSPRATERDLLFSFTALKDSTPELKPLLRANSKKLEHFIFALLRVQNLDDNKLNVMIARNFPELTDQKAFKNLVITLVRILDLTPIEQRQERAHQLVKAYLRKNLTTTSTSQAEIAREKLVAQAVVENKKVLNSSTCHIQANERAQLYTNWSGYADWCKAVEENAPKVAQLRVTTNYSVPTDWAQNISYFMLYSAVADKTYYEQYLQRADSRLWTPFTELNLWLAEFFRTTPIEKLKNFRFGNLPLSEHLSIAECAVDYFAHIPVVQIEKNREQLKLQPLPFSMLTRQIRNFQIVTVLSQLNTAFSEVFNSKTYQNPQFQNDHMYALEDRLRDLCPCLVAEGKRNNKVVIAVARAFTEMLKEFKAKTLTEERATAIFDPMVRAMQKTGCIPNKLKVTIALVITALCAALGFALAGPLGALIASGSAAVVTSVVSCCFWNKKLPMWTALAVNSAQQAFEPFYQKSP